MRDRRNLERENWREKGAMQHESPPKPPPLLRLADDLTALTSMMRALYPRAAVLRDDEPGKQQAVIAQKRDALVQTETPATNVNFDAAERVPREDDLDNLFRLLAIKDAVILKMRSLLPPPLSKHVTHGLPKRAASLIADARMGEYHHHRAALFIGKGVQPFVTDIVHVTQAALRLRGA